MSVYGAGLGHAASVVRMLRTSAVRDAADVLIEHSPSPFVVDDLVINFARDFLMVRVDLDSFDFGANPDDITAMTVRGLQGVPPTIVLNTRVRPGGLRDLSICHELAHLYLHPHRGEQRRDGTEKFNTRQEAEAEAVAMEVVMAATRRGQSSAGSRPLRAITRAVR